MPCLGAPRRWTVRIEKGGYGTVEADISSQVAGGGAVSMAGNALFGDRYLGTVTLSPAQRYGHCPQTRHMRGECRALFHKRPRSEKANAYLTISPNLSGLQENRCRLRGEEVPVVVVSIRRTLG